MIRHGQTGFLCNGEDEMVDHVARSPAIRSIAATIVEQARHAVETELADPETWWRQWREL